MRLVTKSPRAESLDYTAEGVDGFRAYIDREIEDALSARQPQEAVWRETLRQYEGIPRSPMRNVPIENAPNIEITLGAIAVEVVYAQAIDLIFTVSPIITVRAVQPEKMQAAKALQRYVNWGAANEWDIRNAADESILDNVKMGTGIYHIPYTEEIVKTRTQRVTSRGPKALTVPIEDFLVPGGAYADCQKTRWVAHRFWYTQQELDDEARANDWDITEVGAVGAVGWVRSRREMLGRSLSSNVYSELYEVFKVYAYYDIDGDGIMEDLVGVWDRTSRKLLHVEYNRYDKRPYEAMRYQLRGHLFYGLGVMDMVRPYQEECTEIHNAATLNALLANARFWKAKDGSVPETMKVWPGKVQFMADPKDLEPVAMADIYPSMGALQAFPISMAERRIGINDMSAPRPSAVLGSRTPGITALAMQQSTNRRFTPAFDAMRFATAGAVKQCLYRIQERLLAGDKKLEEHLTQVLGVTDGFHVVALLKRPGFEHEVEIELTASSTTINRDVERQNALLLVNLLGQYYQKSLELVTIAASPQTPAPVKDAAKKIAAAATEIIDRTLRTFDQVRDPAQFLIDVEAELDATKDVSQQGIATLMQMLTGGGQQNGGQNPALMGMS